MCATKKRCLSQLLVVTHYLNHNGNGFDLTLLNHHELNGGLYALGA